MVRASVCVGQIETLEIGKNELKSITIIIIGLNRKVIPKLQFLSVICAVKNIKKNSCSSFFGYISLVL